PVLDEPERLNPYAFANSNPELFGDPAGWQFDLVSLNVSLGIDEILEGTEGAISEFTLNYFKSKARGILGEIAGKAFDLVLEQLTDSVEQAFGLPGGVFQAGRTFEKYAQDALCSPAGPFSSILAQVWLEAKVSTSGQPVSDGFNGSQLPS